MRKFDEMYEQLPASGVGGPVRAHYQAYAQWLSQQSADVMAARREEAEMIFRRVGITFAVYGDDEAAERLIPFDIIPRIISGREWRRLAQGIEQRVLVMVNDQKLV